MVKTGMYGWLAVEDNYRVRSEDAEFQALEFVKWGSGNTYVL